MNNLEFLNIKMLWFLALIPFLVICFKYYQKRSQKDLNKFAGAVSLKRSQTPRLIKLLLLCSSIVFLTISLTEPVWRQVPKELKKEGRDLVFILDVSNSMLAEDLIPNRLEKAKISITECVNSLKNHRIGLVVFAGSASIQCPLTLDYDFFLHILSRVNNNSVSYSDKETALNVVSQGGTLIQDAILKTCEKLFTDSKNGNKDIILISDGGDQGKDIDKAIQAVNDIGAKIITIGLGDSLNGARIPLAGGNGFLRYQGKEVWTKLENEILKDFTRKCKYGAYLPAGTKQMDLAQIYEQFTQGELTSSISEQEIMVFKDEYPIFLSLALILLSTMIVLPSSLKTNTVKLLPFAFLLFCPSLEAATLDDAEKAYKAGRYNDAIRFYVEVLHQNEDKKVHIYFNIANAYYRLKNFESAKGAYRNTLSEIEDDSQMTQTVTYNLANALVKSSYLLGKKDAITELSMALRYYRRVIMQNPHLKQAAVNFELAKIELYKKKKELEEERKKEKEIQLQLTAIRALLSKAINEQKQNIELSEEYIQSAKNLNALVKAEKQIIQDSSQAEKLTKDLENKDEVFKKRKVFEESLAYLKKAILKENEAESLLNANNSSAVEPQKGAQENLQKALDSLPEDPQQQQSDEGESDDDGEFGEEEEEDEGEEGGESEDSIASDMSPKDDQGIELPNDTIEDILKMEDQLHKMRKAAETKGRMKKVDKDW